MCFACARSMITARFFCNSVDWQSAQRVVPAKGDDEDTNVAVEGPVDPAHASSRRIAGHAGVDDVIAKACSIHTLLQQRRIRLRGRQAEPRRQAVAQHDNARLCGRRRLGWLRRRACWFSCGVTRARRFPDARASRAAPGHDAQTDGNGDSDSRRSRSRHHLELCAPCSRPRAIRILPSCFATTVQPARSRPARFCRRTRPQRRVQFSAGGFHRTQGERCS